MYEMSPFTVVFFLAFVAVASAASIIPNDTETPFEGWEGRIVGGSTASAGQFPHQASLQSNANAHFCGAFIINTRWVGSAAHCTIGRTAANTRVRVGSNSRTTGGTLFQASAIRNHGSYNSNTLANDISTVQTSGTMSQTNTVRPIPLGSANVGAVSAQVSGWGQTSHPGSAPTNLQFLNTQTLTNADCRARHTAGNANLVQASNICTFTRSGQGTCMGDSGGPLIAGGTVIGAVSWGIACAQGRPDVYARISSFRTWLINNS
ncbi:Chymotrypsin-2 [Pseudolycoriella hygida]|uniref:Chymotrypsin-2 n=1 Tax=Pseudolycoriella hygida TaxID=35572 RepID=A0A9Q0MLU2_9DIPT|nr:Chymotrypsin-2 [Pseudolycoriella hygida]KAJ6647092.1 Chymotrypsin-2 [Pseudolycoriella hygida]